MKIVIAASEALPYAKTGGLADVTGALRIVLRTMGHETSLILPLYRRIRNDFDVRDTGHSFRIPLGDSQIGCRILSHGDSAFFLECDEFFDRDDLYGTPYGDYHDNDARFIFFSRAVIEATRVLGLKPDILHCHDWQTGLIPLYLRTVAGSALSGTSTLFTIHNLGYQGLFDASRFSLTGLSREWFGPEGIEFYGKVNFLKAGLIASDVITTVSSTYAKEIRTPELGYGLDGVLRKYAHKLHGIINGIDQELWDPERDAFIPARFSLTSMEGKEECRKALIRECSLTGSPENEAIMSFVGRLSEQKGIDILLKAAGDFVHYGVKLVVLGQGDEVFHRQILALSERLPGRVFARIGFDEGFARRIYAGSDMLLMPSRYEPCGLSQLIAMRYGTVPLARKTGGLADTISDFEPFRGTGTGFLFDDYRASALRDCVKRALCVYVDRRRWKYMMRTAMKKDFSWKRSAELYSNLYRKARREGKGIRK